MESQQGFLQVPQNLWVDPFRYELRRTLADHPGEGQVKAVDEEMLPPVLKITLTASKLHLRVQHQATPTYV